MSYDALKVWIEANWTADTWLGVIRRLETRGP
jgi:hypothetical protein